MIERVESDDHSRRWLEMNRTGVYSLARTPASWMDRDNPVCLSGDGKRKVRLMKMQAEEREQKTMIDGGDGWMDGW